MESKKFYISFIILSLFLLHFCNNSTGEYRKYRITFADIKTICVGIECYMADYGNAPEDLTFGSKETRFAYIKNFPKKDAFGNEWNYKRSKENPQKYFISSSGSDGKFQGFGEKGIYEKIEGFEDIIFSNMECIYGPAFMIDKHKKNTEKRPGGITSYPKEKNNK